MYLIALIHVFINFCIRQANVRCTNIIKAGQSLLTLISDLKECLIFKDFPAINQSLASQKVDNLHLDDRRYESSDLFSVQLYPPILLMVSTKYMYRNTKT